MAKIAVAPLAGAWIEIIVLHVLSFYELVAPLAGAWIEIAYCVGALYKPLSLPSRERGLKYLTTQSRWKTVPVAPLAGAWIEMILVRCLHIPTLSLPSRERGLKCAIIVAVTPADYGRSPRGSVD